MSLSTPDADVEDLSSAAPLVSTLRFNIDCAVENGTATARFFAAEIGSGKVVPSLFLLVAARSAAAAFEQSSL